MINRPPYGGLRNHTMAIARSGIRELLPPGIRLISADARFALLRRAISTGLFTRPAIMTFADLLGYDEVPGSESSFSNAAVRVRYTGVFPADALQLARQNPHREMVAWHRFETPPRPLLTIIEAQRLGGAMVWSLHKTVPRPWAISPTRK